MIKSIFDVNRSSNVLFIYPYAVISVNRRRSTSLVSTLMKVTWKILATFLYLYPPLPAKSIFRPHGFTASNALFILPAIHLSPP